MFLAVNPEKTVACIQERRLGLPHLATYHLPSASTPQAKDCFPCPCTATIGEEAGNAPSGVSSAWYSSCTSFEKSSLLSSPVPHPDTRHGLFERRPRQLQAELFISQGRSEGESCSSQQQMPLNDTSHPHSRAIHSFNGSISRVLRENENGQFLGDMGLFKVPSSVLATPYDTTAHTVRPYRSDYAPLRAAINWISKALAVK